MDTDSFIVYIKADNIYKEIAEDVKNSFDTSNCELDRQLPRGKNEKNNWINKRWIWWKNYDVICPTRAKPSSNLIDDSSKNKKTKGIRKCVIKKN